MYIAVVLYLIPAYLFHLTQCHNEFTESLCLDAHNTLRSQHIGTGVLQVSARLTQEADIYAERYSSIDSTRDVRPTRVLPKRRKKRHVDDDINPNVHLETWDGEITYPDGSWDRMIDGERVGKSIHKFCCTSEPHCPKEFFHNLLFPPSARDVVYDWYNQEVGNYNFETGSQASAQSPIKHFSNIVWKNTTKIGCAQSKISFNKCVYTVVLYQVEGSIGTPEKFKENVGIIESDITESSSIILIVFLSIFFVVLLCGLLILIYCCRDNLRSKYMDMKIKTDTMKAEQELETDSTRWWWLRACRKKDIKRRRTTVSRPKHTSLQRDRPSIEMIPNSAPQRTRPIPPRIRGQSNAADFAIRYQGIGQKAENYVPYIDRPLPIPPPKINVNIRPNAPNFNQPNGDSAKHPVSRTSSGPKTPVSRSLSSSGKPPPPPVPKTDDVKPIKALPPPPAVMLPPTSYTTRPAPSPPKRPVSNPVTQTKPRPIPRKNTAPLLEETVKQSPPTRAKPPMLPPGKPVTAPKGDETPKSVSEMRKFLENR